MKSGEGGKSSIEVSRPMSQVLVQVCIYALARASTAGMHTTCSVGTAGIIDSTRIDSYIQYRVFEYIEGMLQDLRRTYPGVLNYATCCLAVTDSSV